MTRAAKANTCPTCRVGLAPGVAYCGKHEPPGYIAPQHPALSRTWDTCRCGALIAWARLLDASGAPARLETAVEPLAPGERGALVATLTRSGLFGWPEYHLAHSTTQPTGAVTVREHHHSCTLEHPRAALTDRAVERRKRHERDAAARAEVHTTPPVPTGPEYGCRACGGVFHSTTKPDIAGAVPCTMCTGGLALRTMTPTQTYGGGVRVVTSGAMPPGTLAIVTPPAEPATPSLFDQPTPQQVTDAAIEQVDAAADPEWKRAASAAVFAIATAQPTFTADDIWRRVDKPREPSALGPVLRQCAALGIIQKTDRVQKSERPEAHQKPLPVWRSLVHTPPPVDGLDFAPLTPITGDTDAAPS